MRRREFVLSIACFLGVACFGVIEGIFIAVGLALPDFIRRAWRPYYAVLGRVDGLKGYHDVSRHPGRRRCPACCCSAGTRRCSSPTPTSSGSGSGRRSPPPPRPVRRVVVTAEPMTDVDTSAADVLERVHGVLAADGIELAFAEMKSPVTDQLERYGLLELLGRDSFFPTIGTALKEYVGDSRSRVDGLGGRPDRRRRAAGPRPLRDPPRVPAHRRQPAITGRTRAVRRKPSAQTRSMAHHGGRVGGELLVMKATTA